MELKSKKEEEMREFEKKLKIFLRSTGRLFPETPAQVEAFEKRHPGKVKLPKLLSDPIAMLERGYIYPGKDIEQSDNHSTENKRMAARKGANLSADTIRKMEEDRHNAENQE